MAWNEEQHPRNADGEFTHSSVGSWVKKVAAQLSQQRSATTRDALSDMADNGEHPPGWSGAKRRLATLWDVPSRRANKERTDAEQAELEALEKAFKTYRDELGLTRYEDQHGRYVNASGWEYDEYGAPKGYRAADATKDAPQALKLGYHRVMDHPDRLGSAGADLSESDARYVGRPSIHPLAGGLWIDPNNPGTRHNPKYRTDLGHATSVVDPPQSPSASRKGKMRALRREGMFGAPQGDVERSTRVRVGDWRWDADTPARLGYGMAEAEGGAEFIAVMKRKKARARAETAVRTPKRRTPWAEQVGRDMGRRAGGQ